MHHRIVISIGNRSLALKTRFCVTAAVCLVPFVFSTSESHANREASATQTPINGPSALATDNHGHLFLIEMNENKVQRVDLREGRILTVAGNGKKCCYRNGAKATEVSLDFLRALAVDSHGNIFIGENGRIKKVDGRTGLISTVAGDGTSGETIDGVGARSAHFWDIDGLAVDGDDNLFAADVHQGKIFKVDMKNGTVHHYAGNGKSGYGGDGGLAVNASFRFPQGVDIDRAGNLIVADFENCAIRKIDRETNIIKTLAVSGGPEQNCTGTPDNSRPGAFPSDPVSDSAGNIYFVEGALDFVMRIEADTSSLSVVAGNGSRGFTGDNGAASKAELANPSGLAIDLGGNIFIAEYVNNRVRRVDAKTKIITTIAGNGLPHRLDLQE
jgi:sugar lactone lactonase YvrE